MNKRALYIMKDDGTDDSFTVQVEQWGDRFEWVQDGYSVSLRNDRYLDDEFPPIVSHDIHLDGAFSGYRVHCRTDVASNLWTAVGGGVERECENDTASGWGQVAAAAKLLFAINGLVSMISTQPCVLEVDGVGSGHQQEE